MQPVADVSYLLHHVPSVLHRQSDQALQEQLGIGMSQYKILMMLQWRPKVTQRELADYLGQTEASISRQVKLLLDKGLLVTRIDPAERRRHLTAPTSKGVKVVQAAQELLDQYYAPMFALLKPKQKEELLNLLTALHEHVCAPGKRMACDRPDDIETIYAAQKDA